MAALNFPATPTVGQVYTANGKSWQWNGTAWLAYNLITALSGITIDASPIGQNTAAAGKFTNLEYTGTLTGGTGVINIGSGQLYKDAAGNLGLGVTPSGWGSTFKALQGGAGSLWSYSTSGFGFTANAYNNSGWKYVNNGYANSFETDTGKFVWYTAPSGTAGNAISFTQAMTLDASGNLNVANLTASRALATDASKNLVSSATTSTELGYVSGVTSAIQTQLNSKAPLTGTGTSGSWPINVTGSSASCTGNAATATNATTAGGFTPSQSSGTANRIVVADASGYIQNTYYNSTDNSQASGVTGVMVKAGDNWLRTGTAAAVATFISGQTMNISGSSTSCSGNAATATTASSCSGNSATATNGARAWVSFGGGANGTTAGGILASGSLGVSSVTYNGTGDYTVNFSPALSNANYTYTFGLTRDIAGGGGAQTICNDYGATKSTTALRVRASFRDGGSAGYFNPTYIYMAMFAA
jgi:hypothetical protein